MLGRNTTKAGWLACSGQASGDVCLWRGWAIISTARASSPLAEADMFDADLLTLSMVNITRFQMNLAA